MNSLLAHDQKTFRSPIRKQIVEIAFHLFATQGYHATTIRQIAQTAGVLPSNVYQYFYGKDELYQSVLEQYHPWLAVQHDLTIRYVSGVRLETLDFLQFLAAKWMQTPDGMCLHLVELLEFQGQHVPVLYSRLRAVIASFVVCPGATHSIIDQAAEQLSESAVALFYVLLFDQCLTKIQGNSLPKDIKFDLIKTMRKFCDSNLLLERSRPSSFVAENI